jgi:Diguanylate cyclase, GGDEF domain
MDNKVAILVSTNIVQSIEAIVLAIILLRFYYTYRRKYLLELSWSWWALCVYLASSGLAVYLADFFDALHPIRLIVSSISLVAGYWQIAFLLFGVREIATEKSFTAKKERLILIGLVVLSLFLEFSHVRVKEDAFLRLFIRVGFKDIAAGIAFIFASYKLWQVLRKKKGLGHHLVTWGFLFYGLQQLHYCIVISIYLRTALPTYAYYLGYVDFILQLLIGLGMLIWFFEEERERVMQASLQIEYLSFHDQLTKLPNQKLFLDRLTMALMQAQHKNEKAAVMYLNIDRFKTIN